MSLFGLHWLSPGVLWLLPLAIFPWLSRNQEKTIAWSAFVPVDPLSTVIGISFKVLASLAIALLVLALAQPYIPEKKIEKVGRGAEIVLLLDRSRSMDDAFAVKDQAALHSANSRNSKRRVAKKYLKTFVNKRPDDRFGFVLFSARAIDLLPLTYSKEAILATIEANALGKGLSETNMATALIKAAEMFKGQKYRGARIVLLVSDGGQELNETQKQQIAHLYAQQKLAIYWIYMRSVKGMTLEGSEGENWLWSDSPERKLHQFFKSLDVPYHVFEVESLKTFSQAIDEIDRQQYQALVVEETLPREARDRVFYAWALAAIMMIVWAQIYTAWGVRKAHE